MRNSDNGFACSSSKIITSKNSNPKCCEYVDLRKIGTEYEVIEALYFKVLKIYEHFCLLEKVNVIDNIIIPTGIRECFRWHEMNCYLYTIEEIVNAKVKGEAILIPLKVRKVV